MVTLQHLSIKNEMRDFFLVVQWLRLWTSTAEGIGSIRVGGGTKILHATGEETKEKSKKWTARRLCGPALDLRFFCQYGGPRTTKESVVYPQSTCRGWALSWGEGALATDTTCQSLRLHIHPTVSWGLKRLNVIPKCTYPCFLQEKEIAQGPTPKYHKQPPTQIPEY